MTVPTTTVPRTGTDLTATTDPALLARVTDGAITLSDLVKELAPVQVSAPAPAVIPTAKTITEAQRAAMARVPEVFGQVVPAVRRKLTVGEVESLITERTTLDEVKTMAEKRIEDIKVTVHNHLDTLIEATVPDDQRPLLDSSGHYISAGRAGSNDLDREFSREPRTTSASLNVAALAALDTGEPDALLSHEQYLALTTQVRQVDEAKIMIALRKDPGLIRALAAATTPGKASTSMFLRPRK